MKQNITKDVGHCKKCHKFYVEGVEGDDGICDACFDEQDEFASPELDTYIDEDPIAKEEDKPKVFTEGDCV